MRKYLVLLGLGTILLVIAGYLLWTSTPFNTEAITTLIKGESVTSDAQLNDLLSELIAKGIIWDYLNLTNLLLIGSVLFVGIACVFSFLHLVAARLFWLKFYQQPRLIEAIRRGIEFSLFITVLILMRLYGLEFYYGILVLGLVVGVEYLIWKTLEKPLSAEEAEQKTVFQLAVRGLRLRGASLIGSIKKSVRRGQEE